MALLARVYFNAVFGALGGLLGWMLFGVFGDKNPRHPWQMALLGGALIGGLIGYFVVSVEAIRDQSFLRFVRLASYGVVLGVRPMWWPPKGPAQMLDYSLDITADLVHGSDRIIQATAQTAPSGSGSLQATAIA